MIFSPSIPTDKLITTLETVLGWGQMEINAYIEWRIGQNEAMISANIENAIESFLGDHDVGIQKEPHEMINDYCLNGGWEYLEREEVEFTPAQKYFDPKPFDSYAAWDEYVKDKMDFEDPPVQYGYYRFKDGNAEYVPGHMLNLIVHQFNQTYKANGDLDELSRRQERLNQLDRVNPNW